MASILDNVVAGNGSWGIKTEGGEDGDGIVTRIGYNDFWENEAGDYLGVEAPASDLAVDPHFLDPAAGDYHLREDSPLLSAGSGGGVIGALGLTGEQDPTAVERDVLAEGLPRAHRLGRNYPNPFNSWSTITYEVAHAGLVRLGIYGLTGQRLRVLVEAEDAAGRYAVRWDGRDDCGRVVASGVYLFRMAVGDHRQVRRMLLLR